MDFILENKKTASPLNRRSCFSLSGAQLEGRALRTFAFGGRTVAATHLNGIQRTAVLRAGVIRAGIHRAAYTGVTGPFFVDIHIKPSFLWMGLVWSSALCFIPLADGIFLTFLKTLVLVD